MKEFINIASYQVPVTATVDVCVVGGGPAGLAAAIGASRVGLSVMLIEKNGYCGGATVSGLSGTICGLYSSGDQPEQLVFGFADEIYQALKAKNGVTAPVPFGKTALIPHDTFVWKDVADELLAEARCEVLYHTQFLKAIKDQKGNVSHLLLHAPEGQMAVATKYVVDASGDAAVVADMQGATYMGNQGIVQTPTMMFKMGNVDTDAFLKISPEAMCKAVAKADKSGRYRLPRHHVYCFVLPNSREVLCNMTRITYPDGRIPVGISSKDMTFAEVEGRRQAREYSRFLQDTFDAFGEAYLVETGNQVGIRQTRSIRGKACLRNHDVIHAVKSENAITHSAWPIEAHGAGKLKIAYLENDHYDIPFEVMVPEKAANVLVAGRAICAEHEALASARVTAQCFGMGYAAGAAFGLAKQAHIDLDELSGKMVNQWMKEQKLKGSHER